MKADLPRRSAPRGDASSIGKTAGVFNRSVTAAMLGATGLTACVGAPMLAHADGVDAGMSVGEAAAVLDLDRKDLTPEEMEEARDKLWRAYVESGGDYNSLNTRVGRSETQPATADKTRGELRMERLVKDLEREMRMTARDMVDPNIRPIEGTPGYKEIEANRLRSLIVGALKDMPIGELPGGKSLATLIGGLPGTDGLDIESMTFREVEHHLGDESKEWLKTNFEPLFDEYRVESIAIAFGSITAVRYFSPSAAGVLDDITPKIRLFKERSDDGRLNLRGDLRYRDRNVLPDLDVRATARTEVGPWDVRARVNGTLSLESDDHARGWAEIGAATGAGKIRTDLSARVFDTGLVRAEVDSVYSDLGEDLFVRGRIYTDFGKGSALGDANGRAHWELDLHKNLVLSGKSEGSIGVFVGGGVDLDGHNEDIKAGVMFRLTW